MALTEVHVPDIGDFKDVEVIEVIVSVGDSIQPEDPLITLETDKATMDVPAPAAGTVKEVKVNVGDKVSEGSLILLFEATGEASNADAEIADVDLGTSESTESKPDSTETQTAVSPAAIGQTASEHEPADFRRAPPPAPAQSEQQSFAKIHASPSIRRFARELGVDLSNISGSGRKGRITKVDVQQLVKQVMSGQVNTTATSTASGAGIPAIPAVDFSQFGEIEVQALSRIQKISGPHLHRAWLNVPMVTHHDEADVTELEEFRKSLKPDAEKHGVRVTALAFIMKALAGSMRAFPKFNSSLATDGENLIYKKYCNLGIAVDTPNGLMVPVIRDVDQKSIFELSADLGEISKRARDGKLSAKDLQGGCMSISSLGGIGGTAFTPLVNAPEVAILGVTRSQMKPVWNAKEFVPRLMLPLDVTYDHRVIDGAEAARFMVHLCQSLSDIRRLLL